MTHHSATAWTLSLAALIVSLSTPALSAQDVELDALRQKQRRQEKARGLANELVSGVLEIQLRQLRENRLQHLPIYTEIESMRGNLDELVGNEMQEVVQLLVEAQEGEPAQRLKKFHAARDVIREVVVALMSERQKLLKRLQIARIAAEVRQLIALQGDTLDQTKGLPAAPVGQREQLTLDAIQDQLDVTAIYYQLVATLQDVSGWGGPIATGAGEGLRILKTAQVTEQLKGVDDALQRAGFEAAVRGQRNVIKGLMALLKVIEETQGLIGADREAALKMVREMIDKQEALRETVRADELTEETAKDEFAFEQRQIQQDLGTLAETLAEFPEVEPLVDQSREAAAQAEAELFEGDKTEALLEQGQVVGSLAEIEEQLQQALEPESSDKTADELAEQVKQLEKLDQALDQAVATQEQAAKQAESDPAATRRTEQQVAGQLEAADKLGEFSRGIESRLDDAKDAVAAAAAAAEQTAPEAGPERKADVERAADELRQAAAEVKAELADTRRRQLAVEVGELARAAEALERAAAAERDIADAAAAAAEAKGLTERQASELADQQETVAAVAEKIAEGVKTTAPEAAAQLAAAKPATTEAARELATARQQPGEDSKPAARKAADAAARSAQQLETAAAKLRKSAGQAAQELARQADEQLQPVVAARQAVQDALANVPEDAAARLDKLQQARQDVVRAQIEQLKANGRPAAAAAQETADAIADARVAQDAAERAAASLARGADATPLEASRRQDDVARRARQLADQATPDVADKLNQAADAAAKAAQETLIGKPEDAQAARQAAAAALDEALAAARQAQREAADAPGGTPDKGAQQQVGELTDRARQAVGERPQQVSEALAKAKQESDAAGKALETGNLESATKGQEEVAERLEEAAAGLAEAIAAEKRKQQEKLADQSRESQELADRAALLDTGATAALRQAQRAAQQMAEPTATPAKENGNDDTKTDPRPVEAAELAAANHDVQRGLERAVASLAAREQQLERDKRIAETLTQLAMEQQQARDEIARQAEALKKLADDKPLPPQADGRPPAENAPAEDRPADDARREQQVAAAQALEQASEQFAQAQRATGEGAVEVSGQEEVANQPIRQGLEAAADLGTMPAAPPADALAQAATLADAAAAAEAAPAGEASPAATDDGPMPAQSAEPGRPGNGANANSTADRTAQASPQEDAAASPSSPASETAPAELGNRFVPDSPEVTAQQIAGSEALAEAALAMAQANAEGRPSPSGDMPPNAGEPDQSAPPSSPQDQPAKTSPTATQGGVSQDGEAQDNQEADESPLELNPAAEGDSRSDKESDSTPTGRNFQTEGWFARLPASLQKAIQAKARRGAPRGYEQRLKRYFESLD